MRRALLTLSLLALTGCGAEKAALEEQPEPVSGRAGEACTSNACQSGLVCKSGRGSTLCYPQTWFTGQKKAFCFTDSDCNAGLTCDLAAANPFTNGVCVTAPGAS